MNFANLRSKTSLIILSAAVSATLVATDAAAQRRGGGGGGRPGGGGGRPMGQAVARGPVVRGGGSRVFVGAPFRGAFYRPYYRGFYGYGPAFSIGFYGGYPFYGYGYYGYPYYAPYPYYGYPYAYPYGGYPYGGYPYAGANAYPAAYGGYGSVQAGSVQAYAGVRIQGAPPNAEVFADGNSVGIAEDFAGGNQPLELPPGAHSIEIRAPGRAAMVYDVNVQPGRTVTLYVR
jgi:hypothetical protein